MKFLKNANGSSRRLSDSNLLLVITIAIFVVMYICAVAFIGSGFTKVQTFFNILFFACNTLVSFYYSVSHLRNDQFYSTDSIVISRNYIIKFLWITVSISDTDKWNSKCVCFLNTDSFLFRIYYENSVWKCLHVFDSAKVLLKFIPFFL